jgi:hypothetical protein
MDELTAINGKRPPSWDEMEQHIQAIKKGLEQWEDSCAMQLPSERDKREFLVTITMFYERISSLQNSYYDLIDDVLRGYDMRKSRPDAFPLDPAYDKAIQIMKSLPDVKKKWLRHKK